MNELYDAIKKLKDDNFIIDYELAKEIAKRTNATISNTIQGIVDNKILITESKIDFIEFIFNRTFIGRGLMPHDSQLWQRAIFLELVVLEHSNVTFVLKNNGKKVYVYLTGLGDEHYAR